MTTTPRPTPATYRVSDLNAEQRRRAACLAAARAILGPDANLTLVVRVARWLTTGMLPT